FFLSCRTPGAALRIAATSRRSASALPPQSVARSEPTPGAHGSPAPSQATRCAPLVPLDLPGPSAYSYSSASTSEPCTADSAGQIAATNAAPRIAGINATTVPTGNL